MSSSKITLDAVWPAIHKQIEAAGIEVACTKRIAMPVNSAACDNTYIWPLAVLSG